MSKLGIVCEGGGTRGAYTGGFLSWCLDNNIPIDYINGISAGAVTACMYVSKQPERMKNLCIKYIADSRYVGLGAILNEGKIAGINFVFDDIEKMEPTDTETLLKNPVDFEFGLFNCESGEVEYFGKNEVVNDREMFKASCRLPGLVPIAHLHDHFYFDGGVKTMIPIKRAEEKGVEFNFVVLTKPDNYIRQPEKNWQMRIINQLYGKKFPKLMENLYRRHTEYAEEIDYIYKRQEEGKTFVLRPSVDMHIGRMCKDADLLSKMWDLGYSDSEAHREDIMRLVERAKGNSHE